MMRQNYNAFARMTDFCETRVPAGVREALLPIMSDDEAVKDYGVELGIRMCKTLMEAGAPGLLPRKLRGEIWCCAEMKAKNRSPT